MPQEWSVEDEIVTALRRIIRAVDLHSKQLQREIGLTWPQVAVLRSAELLGQCTLHELAKAVHLADATLSGIVQRLERVGYLQRVRGERDRREVRLSITPAGVSLLQRTPSLLQDRFSRELAAMKDWEQSQTLASLQRIAEMMEARDLDASPLLVTGPLDATQSQAIQTEKTQLWTEEPRSTTSSAPSPPSTQIVEEEKS